ncbi:FAD/NAD(P)-binding domain-containing protein [Xylariaceae sp. FL0804]|nr:FAD/NAD(P)-binding domain-containing protein [Xylariaceae sp. FL0804]
MAPVRDSRSPVRRVAIVGSGISGIACAWELRKEDFSVDIFESEKRPGGHANSVPFTGNGRTVNVDTGFIVMDEYTYPQFNRFLVDLGVETIPTDMSFGVSTTNELGFEWSSDSILGFIRKLPTLFDVRFWTLVRDIMWFNLFARSILFEDSNSSETHRYVQGRSEKGGELLGTAFQEPLGTYLIRSGYSEWFISYFLIPMIASPWCTDPVEFARTFPAKLAIQSMLQHGLLDTMSKTLRWRAFRDGSKTYVDTFQRQIPSSHQIHLGTAVMGVERAPDGVSLTFSDGESQRYDHVVLAIPANQALTLLGETGTVLERKTLGSFETSRNICVLHSDTSLLPSCPSGAVAWNCSLESKRHTADCTGPHVSNKKSCSSGPRISVTFDMNRLQGIPPPGTSASPGRVLVTMNPHRTPKLQQGIYEYHHPLITSRSVMMARQMNKINGADRISFAGAWMGFGFHEDGFAAGVHAARTIVNGFEMTEPLDLFSAVGCQPLSWLGVMQSIMTFCIAIVRGCYMEILKRLG